MLKKIDCVMVKVENLPAATEYYANVFGLKINWQDETSVGLRFSDGDSEVVLHRDLNIPVGAEVHYLVEDVLAAIATCEENGCQILVQPFDIAIGKCAVIKDPFGKVLALLDMTKGPR